MKSQPIGNMMRISVGDVSCNVFYVKDYDPLNFPFP